MHLRDDFNSTSLASVVTDSKAGGIAVISDENLLVVEEVAVTNQEVHCMMKVRSLS